VNRLAQIVGVQTTSYPNPTMKTIKTIKAKIKNVKHADLVAPAKDAAKTRAV